MYKSDLHAHCVCLHCFLKASGRDTYGDTSSESSNSVPSSPVHHQRSLKKQGQLCLTVLLRHPPHHTIHYQLYSSITTINMRGFEGFRNDLFVF